MGGNLNCTHVHSQSEVPDFPIREPSSCRKLELLIRRLSDWSSPPLDAVSSYESTLAFHKNHFFSAPRQAGPHRSPGSYDLKRAYSNAKYLWVY